jgi:hypothetical protein
MDRNSAIHGMPLSIFTARASSVPMESDRGFILFLVAFSRRKPASTLLENALGDESINGFTKFANSDSREFAMARVDLTDFEWSVIQPLLSNKPRGGWMTGRS